MCFFDSALAFTLALLRQTLWECCQTCFPVRYLLIRARSPPSAQIQQNHFRQFRCGFAHDDKWVSVAFEVRMCRLQLLSSAAPRFLQQLVNHSVSRCLQPWRGVFLGVAERFWFHRWTGFLADLTAEWKWRRSFRVLLEGGEQRRFNYTESAGVYISLRFNQILHL